MKTIKKISTIILYLAAGSIFLLVAIAILSPTDDTEKNARIACMTETQMRFGNDIVHGNMPSDRVVLPNGGEKFTVQLRFKKKYDTTGSGMATAVCDVEKDDDGYKAVSLSIVKR